MRKKRSASYPPHTIKYALDFTAKIYENYGHGYRSKREEIASALGYSVGSLNNKISASVQYGFLNVKPKEGYMVTDLFVRYFKPLNEDDKNAAIHEAFKNPKLYSTLIELFDGNILPPTKPLSNILLHKHNISDGACEIAARVFQENVEDLGYLKEGRIFSFDPDMVEQEAEAEEDFQQEEEFEEEVPETNFNIPPPMVYKGNRQNQNNSQDKNGSGSGHVENKPIPHNIPLKDKLPAQLLLPSDVSGADFDFIISYIGLIRNQY